MSDERFAEILNELQARDDREKLVQLFGQYSNRASFVLKFLK
jgi:hypothetical protein